jgi:hypothetical protein
MSGPGGDRASSFVVFAGLQNHDVGVSDVVHESVRAVDAA